MSRKESFKGQKIKLKRIAAKPKRLTNFTKEFILKSLLNNNDRGRSMLTQIGKEMRKLRIDREERLFDMAKKLSKSSAFISAIELGKKQIPNDFEELIIKYYKLTDEAADAIRTAADRSRDTFKIEPNNILGRDTAGLMARKINSLSDQELQNIQKILKRGKKGQNE